MDEIDLTSKKPLSSRLTKSRTDTKKSLDFKAQNEDKVLGTKVSKGFSLCKVV